MTELQGLLEEHGTSVGGMVLSASLCCLLTKVSCQLAGTMPMLLAEMGSSWWQRNHLAWGHSTAKYLEHLGHEHRVGDSSPLFPLLVMFPKVPERETCLILHFCSELLLLHKLLPSF